MINCGNSICGKELTKRQIKDKQIYCSRKCYGIVNRKRLPSNSLCITCGEDMVGMSVFSGTQDGIQTKRKFCSQSCSATFNNANKKTGIGSVSEEDKRDRWSGYKYPGKSESYDKSKEPKKYVSKRRTNKPKKYPKKQKINIVQCKWCHGKYNKRESDFCSPTCKATQEVEFLIDAWLAGDNSAVTRVSGKLSPRIINWIKKQVDYRCEECGSREFHPLDGNPAVQVDHIDGNSKNQDPSNLRVLCPMCHWRTDTYCGRNITKQKINSGG